MFITDAIMPIMDGPTTIVALKAINPDVKIISPSGAASADAQHLLPKPHTADALLKTLHEVLRKDHAK